MSKIPVMEVFGPTIQGEGMVIGQKTMFVRTAGCDYSCSWCDSSFTWDGTGKELIKQMSAEEILAELRRIGGDGFSFVTISGGNPALLKNMGSLIELLQQNQIKVCLETQGSRWQDWFYEIDELTLSPKPPSSGMVTDFGALDMIITNLEQRPLNKNISLKVVVFTDDDYDYARSLHFRYPEVPFFLQVGNEDTTTKDDGKLILNLLEKYQLLIDKVMNDQDLKNVKVLPQLHTYIWGNKRGV
ncbi:7-carboxy-7-deazaguanine synthase QueE [Bacillus canaveralius]|uniref:7-carboxy-7-deazaguanine synthase n=1 Tax=Bacillus canaveralius TaxID=1403243 RepID=A0A2N5GG47_9BACI|nr:7-carboxy-7-deazaguanine synthase QueE [Bacillus canaveralius]PLR79744.1 7-carboxy-7-deazaguanine synthase QueE [Bacillus canaveralius]PLR93154.1 7-carboxy-7-deazaguanine synthase QueE [Bacillus canaveralius]